MVYFLLEVLHIGLKNRDLCIQGAPIKNNPLGKIHFLSYCKRFFHQIYSFYRGGFSPYRQQISSHYLLWFKNYNHL